MSRISVLVPTYNQAQFLSGAIDSLLNQTRRPDEIIVVDDGSTDDVAAVVARYSGQIISLRQENRGAAAARNAAYARATGDLIAFLDADDTLDPTSIEKRAALLDAHPDLDFVYTGAYMTDSNGSPTQWFRKPPLPSGDVFHAVICRALFPVHAVMFRRSIVGRSSLFDEDQRLRVAEDMELWSHLLADHPVAAIDEALAFYRSHSGTVTSRRVKLAESHIAVQEKIMQMPAFARLERAEQAAFYLWHGTYHFEAQDNPAARRFLLRALRMNPTLRRAWFMLAMTWLGTDAFQFSKNMYRRLISGR